VKCTNRQKIEIFTVLNYASKVLFLFSFLILREHDFQKNVSAQKNGDEFFGKICAIDEDIFIIKCELAWMSVFQKQLDQDLFTKFYK